MMLLFQVALLLEQVDREVRGAGRRSPDRSKHRRRRLWSKNKIKSLNQTTRRRPDDVALSH
jgi:hypothetical protein